MGTWEEYGAPNTAAFGVTATLETWTRSTVTVADPCTPSDVARISTVPWPTPPTTPLTASTTAIP